ncbi:MAG: hypothetical protein WKF54_07850 [Nocardioidaceae bacterium]
MGEDSIGTATTGDERVNTVVARLDELGTLDLPGQLRLFSELHTSLVAVLDAHPAPEDAGQHPTGAGETPPPAS